MPGFVLGDQPLTLEAIADVARGRLTVRIGERARGRMARARRAVERVAEGGKDAPSVYGINTGFGALAEVRIEAANKIGMLASISAAIAGTGTNIGHANVEQRDGDISLITMEVEVKDRKHLARVVRTIRQMPEVLRVSRYQASRRSDQDE